MAKDKKLKVGEIAPEFCLTEAEGNTICLADLIRDGNYALLYFAPTEERRRCDRSSCPLKENLDKILELGINVAVIDPDPVEEHKRFKREHNIKFYLLSDPEYKVIQGYGVYEKVNVDGIQKYKIVSTVYLINPKGKILYVWEPKVIEDSIEDILKVLKTLKK